MRTDKSYNYSESRVSLIKEDAEAFAKIYGLDYEELYSYDSSMKLADDQIRDIVQDIFMKFYTHPSFIKQPNTIILLDEMNKPIGGLEYRYFSGASLVKKTYVPAERGKYTERDYWWLIPQQEIDLNEGRVVQNND